MPETNLMTNSRTRPRLIALSLLAMLSLAGAVLSGCGAADKVRAAADPVEEAVAATAKAGGARVAMRVGIDAPEAPKGAAFTADGILDIARGEMQMTIDMSSLAGALGDAGSAPDPADLDMEMRLVDEVMYMRMDLLAGVLPDGKRWIKLDTREIGKSLGIDMSQLSQYNDPTQMLKYLREAGSVERVGRARVRGTSTTHYRAQIDIGKALKQLSGSAMSSEALSALDEITGGGTLPVEVWIDDANLVRRMELKMSAAGEQKAPVFSMSLQMDLYDYGTSVSVDVPPAAEVADGSKLLGAAGA